MSASHANFLAQHGIVVADHERIARAVAQGLQTKTSPSQSATAPHAGLAAHEVVPAKVAAVLATVDELTDLVKHLEAANTANVKAAAALIEAVRLATDGIIDTDAILEVARQKVAAGAVKVATFAEEFKDCAGVVADAAT